MSELQESSSPENQHTNPSLSSKGILLWQERLLPLMVRIIVGLTVFFFLASLGQLVYLHWNIQHGPKPDDQIVSKILPIAVNTEFEKKFQAAPFRAAITLELHALERRYHQVNAVLMTSIWIRYLSFVTGMILAMVGAVFILGKLQGPMSELEAKSSITEFSFKSASPGIILAGLGVILILSTIITQHTINVQDSPLYTRQWFIPSDIANPTPTTTPIPTSTPTSSRTRPTFDLSETSTQTPQVTLSPSPTPDRGIKP